MQLFKRFICSILIVYSLIAIRQSVSAQQPVTIHLFHSEACPHCVAERTFLKDLKTRYPDVNIIEYEVTKNQENAALFEKVGRALYASTAGVPFTLIGTTYIRGFDTAESTGKQLEKLVIAARDDPDYHDVVAEIIAGTYEQKEDQQSVSESAEIPEYISVPLIGKLSIRDLSLPVLTIVIAALDGFNPCAMWVLIFLISLLLPMKDRKRMWVLGITFIAASAFVYFLFLTAWLNLFLFIGFIWWVRGSIGLAALGTGVYYIRDYVTNPSGTCKVEGGETKKRVVSQLKTLTHEKNLLLAIGGIIVLAFSVNLIEAICSAGLPAVFTNILSLSKLPSWHYYAYLLLYMIIFMLDDMIVFTVAMVTLKTFDSEGKYTRYSRLIGGIIMLLIGLAMLLKPELLTFG
ncbi:hypothetical protein HY468_02390 [Candidatus Roizmanbacteria bacterium]|nr:hypothetical protein [Candidatus Roizmanbacteria bacterium]